MSVEDRLRQTEIDIARLQKDLEAYKRIAKALPGLLEIRGNLKISGDFFGAGVEWTSYTPTFGGFSVDPTNVVARYLRIGSMCIVSVYMGTAGTSNATNFTVSAPFASANISGMYWYNALPYYIDGGTAVRGQGNVRIIANIDFFQLQTAAGIVGWTASGNKMAIFQITYEV
jgi:hypothetical protein